MPSSSASVPSTRPSHHVSEILALFDWIFNMYSQTNVPQPESAGVGASVRGAANVSYSVMFLIA